LHVDARSCCCAVAVAAAACTTKLSSHQVFITKPGSLFRLVFTCFLASNQRCWLHDFIKNITILSRRKKRAELSWAELSILCNFFQDIFLPASWRSTTQRTVDVINNRF
jgi:hypothetical protein